MHRVHTVEKVFECNWPSCNWKLCSYANHRSSENLERLSLLNKEKLSIPTEHICSLPQASPSLCSPAEEEMYLLQPTPSEDAPPSAQEDSVITRKISPTATDCLIPVYSEVVCPLECESATASTCTSPQQYQQSLQPQRDQHALTDTVTDSAFDEESFSLSSPCINRENIPHLIQREGFDPVGFHKSNHSSKISPSQRSDSDYSQIENFQWRDMNQNTRNAKVLQYL